MGQKDKDMVRYRNRGARTGIEIGTGAWTATVGVSMHIANCWTHPGILVL